MCPRRFCFTVKKHFSATETEQNFWDVRTQKLSRRSVLTAKCSYVEVSVRRSIRKGKCPTAKSPTAKCPSVKSPTVKCPVTLRHTHSSHTFVTCYQVGKLGKNFSMSHAQKWASNLNLETHVRRKAHVRESARVHSRFSSSMCIFWQQIKPGARWRTVATQCGHYSL